MLTNQGQNGGFIKIIILIVVVLMILSFFGLDLKNTIDKVVQNPMVQKNFNFVKKGANFVWKNYLSKPTIYFWNNILLNFINKSAKNLVNPEFIKEVAPNVENNKAYSL